MIFGDRTDFAIEAQIEPARQRLTERWGRMCVWVRSTPLGDIDNPHCSLYSAHIALVELVKNIASLDSAELCGLDDTAVWNHLDGALYGYHGDVELVDTRTAADCRADWARWGRFNFLTNWGEPFDGYKAFIFGIPGGRMRILSRGPRGGSSIVSSDISREMLVIAARDFAKWFDDCA